MRFEMICFGFFSIFAVPKNYVMKKTIIVGRKREMSELQHCMESDRSEFVIVYGRRRIGKTFLVDNFFHQQYDFSFVGGHRLSKEKQLRNFAKSLKLYAKLSSNPKFSDWDDAFDALENYLNSLPVNKRKVVFFDEMPWIDTPQSEFVDALEMFWNGWAARRGDIVFIATGSSTSWMMDKIVENQGGLHGRITANIYVRPFTLNEVELYLKSRGTAWDRYQILQSYMVLGGIPYYYSLLNVKESLVQNIDRLFFRKNGELQVEFGELYNALFNNADKYIAIVKLLNGKREGMTREEIRIATKMDSSVLSKVLRNLERCDFVLRYSQFGNKKKGAIYRLIDFYTLFYYRFVDSLAGLDEQWWTHNFNSHAVESWQGLSFELISLLHLNQIKQKLGIAGISTSASSWRYVPSKKMGDGIEKKGAQIDLLIDRADRTINLCEMKFSVAPFVVSESYEWLLRNRMSVFREQTKCTKTLVYTFVTTFGVAGSNHSSIVQSEVTMDDLFA